MNGNTYPLPSSYSYQFVKCDVRQWKEQVEVFKAAIANSPHKSVDIVIANAGISGDDPLYKLGMIFPLLLTLEDQTLQC